MMDVFRGSRNKSSSYLISHVGGYFMNSLKMLFTG